MPTPPRITDRTFFVEYTAHPRPQSLGALWAQFAALEIAPDNMRGADTLPMLAFANDVASVHSSQIEGNSLDLNFFMQSKQRGEVAKPKKREFQEIEDVRAAYNFAQEHSLTEQHFLHAHKTLSKRFLITSKRGNYRNHGMMIQSAGGIEYVAIEEEYIPEAMQQFWNGIEHLKQQDLSPSEAFYHAALLHLVFVHIHPFSDGNGRSVRLLEKWFLAHHLGKRAWHIPSETLYLEHRKAYFANIKLGVNYYELDYSRAMPFLLMLPEALTIFLDS
ncbi:MAG: Fic family protein [Candidatus Kapabacteria bacterium]|jgi:Fic family protein|nr:Fic family protein [Candidatus Kapabacteria bacterium]